MSKGSFTNKFATMALQGGALQDRQIRKGTQVSSAAAPVASTAASSAALGVSGKSRTAIAGSAKRRSTAAMGQPPTGRRSPSRGGGGASGMDLLGGVDGQYTFGDGPDGEGEGGGGSGDGANGTSPREAALEQMVRSAQQHAAARRAALEEEADRQLLQSRSYQAAERAKAITKAKAQAERLHQRLRITNVGVESGGSAAAAAESHSALTAGISQNSKGSWSEAFSRKRAMNRMTEAVAAAAASMETSVATTPRATRPNSRAASAGLGRSSGRLGRLGSAGTRSDDSNSPTDSPNESRAQSAGAGGRQREGSIASHNGQTSLTAALYGVGGSGFDNSPFLEAMRESNRRHRRERRSNASDARRNKRRGSGDEDAMASCALDGGDDDASSPSQQLTPSLQRGGMGIRRHIGGNGEYSDDQGQSPGNALVLDDEEEEEGGSCGVEASDQRQKAIMIAGAGARDPSERSLREATVAGSDGGSGGGVLPLPIVTLAGEEPGDDSQRHQQQQSITSAAAAAMLSVDGSHPTSPLGTARPPCRSSEDGPAALKSAVAVGVSAAMNTAPHIGVDGGGGGDAFDAASPSSTCIVVNVSRPVTPTKSALANRTSSVGAAATPTAGAGAGGAVRTVSGGAAGSRPPSGGISRSVTITEGAITTRPDGAVVGVLPWGGANANAEVAAALGMMGGACDTSMSTTVSSHPSLMGVSGGMALTAAVAAGVGAGGGGGGSDATTAASAVAALKGLGGLGGISLPPNMDVDGLLMMAGGAGGGALETLAEEHQRALRLLRRSDIKSNVAPHEPVRVRTVGCELHDLAPFVAYCHTCHRPICAVCMELGHPSQGLPDEEEALRMAAAANGDNMERSFNARRLKRTNTTLGPHLLGGGGGGGASPNASPTIAFRHHTTPLADFVNGLADNISAVNTNNQHIVRQLDALEAQHPDVVNGLHAYVDEEIDGLVRTLEDKRGALHAEVGGMKASLLQLLTTELDACERALGQLEGGKHVLELVMAGQGTSHTHMGELIHGTLPYDKFLLEADPVLSVPPRVTEQLLLQLPIQSLQDVCDLVTWTEASMGSAPQIFPM